MPEKSQNVEKVDVDLTLNENQPQAEIKETEKVAEQTVATPAEAPVEATPAPVVEKAEEPKADEAEAKAEDTPPAKVDTPIEKTDESAEEKAEDAPAAERRKPETKAEVLEQLRALTEKDPEEVARDEVSYLKQVFYGIQRADVSALREEFIAAGNQPEAFSAPEDPDEETLKELLNTIKEKKAARLAELEAELQRNYDAKEALINELLTLAADTDNVNRQFPRFREIQQEFKAIGDVPPQLMSDQWKKYQDSVEHFYDQLKVNKDLRDYDFKKNLETKLHLCEEAEQLAAEEDVITAFKRLQDLHVKWRETGPVAKDVRQEIWDRFKEASTIINKKYQAIFEERKQREQENEAAKTAICERVEALDFDALKSYADWNAMTETILAAQADWKQLGFASKKANNALFARFRETCDRFFALKAEFFKKIKDTFAENLARKTALCEQAESLKESTDWKATADKLVALQKEWKEVGPVPKKQSDAVWNRFMAACDYFFERKKKDFTSTRQTEQANLKAKRALTASLKELPDDTDRAKVLEAIKEAQAQWQQIGHVPFREKDKAYEEFRAAINDLYAKFDLRQTRANFARFESSVEEMSSDENKLYRERERLARVLDQKRSELNTYNNNLGFFNFKSAGASSLQRDIERKTRRLEEDIKDLENKIKIIDQRL